MQVYERPRLCLRLAVVVRRSTCLLEVVSAFTGTISLSSRPCHAFLDVLFQGFHVQECSLFLDELTPRLDTSAHPVWAEDAGATLPKHRRALPITVGSFRDVEHQFPWSRSSCRKSIPALIVARSVIARDNVLLSFLLNLSPCTVTSCVSGNGIGCSSGSFAALLHSIQSLEAKSFSHD